MNYKPLYTEAFNNCIEKHKDKKKRIKSLVNKILRDPFYKSCLLIKVKGVDLQGKRRRHLTANFVMVYAICEECIRQNYLQYNNCTNCNGKPKKRVVLIAFAKHDDIYKKWKSKLVKNSPLF